MTRLNAMLCAILVVCALGLVASQDRARKLFVDLERSQAKARQLEVQWSQLELDQSRLATSSLIDSKARKGLAMQPAPPQRTLYLVVDPINEQTAMVPQR